jgi:hypothetical protein
MWLDHVFLRQFVYCSEVTALVFQSSFVMKREVIGMVTWCNESLHR